MTWLNRSRACGLAASLVALTASPAATAQVGSPTVTAGARGTFGGLLLGGEVVMLVGAAAGVRPGWLYAVGGGAGAIGGAVAGWHLDDAGHAPLSMTLLVSGILLAVPTTISVLSATSYRAPAVGNHEGVIATYAPPVRHRPTLSFAEYSRDSLALGVPAVEISQVYSKKERVIHKVPKTTQVLVPIFRMTF